MRAEKDSTAVLIFTCIPQAGADGMLVSCTEQPMDMNVSCFTKLFYKHAFIYLFSGGGGGGGVCHST